MAHRDETPDSLFRRARLISPLAIAALALGAALAQDFEPVDPFTEDLGPLNLSLRELQRDLRAPQGFERVYEVPGHEDLLMRVDGGLYAVFPQSVYVGSRFGPLPVIPNNTVFQIGLDGLDELVTTMWGDTATYDEANDDAPARVDITARDCRVRDLRVEDLLVDARIITDLGPQPYETATPSHRPRERTLQPDAQLETQPETHRAARPESPAITARRLATTRRHERRHRGFHASALPRPRPAPLEAVAGDTASRRERLHVLLLRAAEAAALFGPPVPAPAE